MSEDLNIAGSVMLGMGAMAFVAALLLTVAAWMLAEEGKTLREEARPESRAAAEAAIAAYRAERNKSTQPPARGGTNRDKRRTKGR